MVKGKKLLKFTNLDGLSKDLIENFRKKVGKLGDDAERFLDDFKDASQDQLRKIVEFDLVDAWKVLSEANVNDILRRNTDELKKISDDISEVKRLGYSNWKRIVNSTSKLKLKKLKGIKIDGNATAIGRMDALKKYDGYSNVDSWKKTGRKPGSTGEKVTWTENRKWLQDRIDRGDVFIMSIDPKTLPPVKGGFVPNQPNGYFTAREFDMLKKQGAKIILDY